MGYKNYARRAARTVGESAFMKLVASAANQAFGPCLNRENGSIQAQVEAFIEGHARCWMFRWGQGLNEVVCSAFARTEQEAQASLREAEALFLSHFSGDIVCWKLSGSVGKITRRVVVEGVRREVATCIASQKYSVEKRREIPALPDI